MQFVANNEYIVINRITGEVSYWIPDEKGYFATWNSQPSAVSR